MGIEGSELLRELILNHLKRSRRAASIGQADRAPSVDLLYRELIDEATARLDDLSNQVAKETDPRSQQILVRGLERLLREVESVLPQLQPYLDDARRRDVAVGLQVSLSRLIERLLPEGAEPIVHLDSDYMYATLDLRRALGRAPNGTPSVVFFVPGCDPFNALLLPILAHEAGHTAIDQANLGSEVVELARQQLDVLLATHLAGADQQVRRDCQVQLLQWVDELLCDALAVAVCGPAFLFAAAAFLPATADGVMSATHPFPSDRLRITLNHLEALGWNEICAPTAAQTMSWLRDIAARQPTSGNEEFLRQACEVLEPHLLAVATGHVSAFLPEHYVAVSEPALRHLRRRTPPCEVAGSPLQPEQIQLAGWLYGFELHGDLPKSLATIVADEDLSKLLMRAVEAARIQELWATT